MLLDNWSDARMHWARMLVEATETGTDALWNEATTKNPDEEKSGVSESYGNKGCGGWEKMKQHVKAKRQM